MKELKLILSILILTLAVPFANAEETVNQDDPALQAPVLQNDDQFGQAVSDGRNTIANVTGEPCCDQEKLDGSHRADTASSVSLTNATSATGTK